MRRHSCTRRRRHGTGTRVWPCATATVTSRDITRRLRTRRARCTLARRTVLLGRQQRSRRCARGERAGILVYYRPAPAPPPLHPSVYRRAPRHARPSLIILPALPPHRALWATQASSPLPGDGTKHTASDSESSGYEGAGGASPMGKEDDEVREGRTRRLFSSPPPGPALRAGVDTTTLTRNLTTPHPRALLSRRPSPRLMTTLALPLVALHSLLSAVTDTTDVTVHSSPSTPH